MVLNKLKSKTGGKNHEGPETEKLDDTEIMNIVAIFPSTGGWIKLAATHHIIFSQ